jgi:hypothetical protein
MKRIDACLVIALFGALLSACGSQVRGNTYHNNGGAVQVEFKSGGKASVSAGPTSRMCSYSESGMTVTLICNSDITSFSVQNDGALVGPAEGLMARLTPVKN